MKRIEEIDIDHKRVIVRCDFNVPMKDGKITDNTKIIESLETIRYCIEHNAKVIVLSHLGRVKEESDLEKYNILPVAEELSNQLNQEVLFSSITRGIELDENVYNMKDGQVLLVQNTRYEDLDGNKESGNDAELAAYWASLGEVFINDAFGTLHRAHASNVGIASHLESGIGFLVERELAALSLLDDPDRPYVVILGGAKVADKIEVIETLAKKADKVLIGGGMAYTFLKAKGLEIGESLLDEANIEFCKNLLDTYPEKIVLPVDAVVSTNVEDPENHIVKDINTIAIDEMGLDIGPATTALFSDSLKDAAIAVWNGPLGMYENDNYKNGTNDLLKFIVDNNVKVILAGGDIVAASRLAGLKDFIFYASTGGGSTLEYLEGKKLPGLEAIK